MKNTTTHICYEWEEFTEVEIAGKVRTYSNGFRSRIIHRLDKKLGFWGIPKNAYKTPVFYKAVYDTWHRANGQELILPFKVCND